MKPTDCFGADVARILQEQRRAGLMSALAERRTLEASRGGALWTSSRGSRRLAANAFVGVGVDLCGCGERGCDACSASERCVCGKVDCGFSVGSVVPAKVVGVSAGRRAYLGPPPPPAGFVPPPWLTGPGVVTPNIDWSIVAPEGADEVDASDKPFAGTYFDTHSHNFMSTYSDWNNAAAGVAGTATAERIDWLASFACYDVGRMVISAMVDDTSGTDPVNESTTGNLITAWAATRYPDFFVPFVQLFPNEIDSGAAAYVEGLLAAGFEGVGELIIHGHGADTNDNTWLTAIGKVAAPYGVPVQMHWEFGNVANWGARTAAENYDQLIEFLDEFPNIPVAGFTFLPGEPVPLKVILCHCGAGPQGMTDELRDAWKERLTYLLETYRNVYFDLAGMQVTRGAELYDLSGLATKLGEVILDLMSAHPGRFLLGYDTETRMYVGSGGYWGVTDYLASIPHYDTFLNLSTLTASEQQLIRSGNALVALYLKPTPWAPATASYSASAHVGP